MTGVIWAFGATNPVNRADDSGVDDSGTEAGILGRDGVGLMDDKTENVFEDELVFGIVMGVDSTRDIFKSIYFLLGYIYYYNA